MRKLTIIFILLTIIFVNYSCEEKHYEAGFEDQEDLTIYDYIVENEADYSSFLSILEKAGISQTISAYNPEGTSYTMFLPNNEAISSFIDESNQFSSLDDLLNDEEYASEMARYHIVDYGVSSPEFPFGALAEYTFTGDLLTVNFIIEPDTSYYLINNQAPIIIPDIELSNGWVHVINKALIPITFTSYDWLEMHQEDYSIFKALIDATGLKETVDFNRKDETSSTNPVTLLIEPDSVYNADDIYSLSDLAEVVSPDNSDYTDPRNPLYNFAAYHILEGSMFLNDFLGQAPNYLTFSEIPLNINGIGLEIAINKGKGIRDTIISGSDTTLIDFVGFYYDESNIVTQSGGIHFINRILWQVPPSRSIRNFQFWEESLIYWEYRLEPGEYHIEDTSWLDYITWSGADLFYVQTGDEEHPAWSGDYLFMNGDFSIAYTFPKIIQGNYTAYIRAESFTTTNAIIQVYIDGKNIGGLINLKTGGSAGNPYTMIELGAVNFAKYEEHTFEVTSLIPGTFSWDIIRFVPL